MSCANHSALSCPAPHVCFGLMSAFARFATRSVRRTGPRGQFPVKNMRMSFGGRPQGPVLRRPWFTMMAGSVISPKYAPRVSWPVSVATTHILPRSLLPAAVASAGSLKFGIATASRTISSLTTTRHAEAATEGSPGEADPLAIEMPGTCLHPPKSLENGALDPSHCVYISKGRMSSSPSIPKNPTNPHDFVMSHQ